MAARVALIIQARMNSTRLPGKSLMDLAGAPLIGRILERVLRCRCTDVTVLAVPDRPEDDPLAALAGRYGVELFRGHETDLVDRYYQAARAVGADTVVRLPGDNPVPEPEEIDRIIVSHQSGNYGFSSNLAQVLGNGYPDGIGAEAMTFSALEEVWRTEVAPDRREHVHLSFFDYGRQQPVNPDRFPVGTVPCPVAFRRPDLVLDVNTAEQYHFMRSLYEALYPANPCFHITDIIRWLEGVRSVNAQLKV